MFQGTKQRSGAVGYLTITAARIWGILSYLKDGVHFLFLKTPHPYTIHIKAATQSYFFITSLIYGFVNYVFFYLRELNEM